MLAPEGADDVAFMAKYRATPQFKQAWKIINPSREHQPECEYWLVSFILSVPDYKELQEIKPAEEKRKLQKGAKRLRAAIPFLNPALAEFLTTHAKIMEDQAGEIVVGKGKRPRSYAKMAAVHYAHALLGNFGSTLPTRHRKGAWHELAKVLCPGARDLFDYIEGYRLRVPFMPLKMKIVRRLGDIES